MLALAQARARSVAVPGPQRRLADTDQMLAVLAAGAALAELGKEPVKACGIHPAEPQLSQRRDDPMLD